MDNGSDNVIDLKALKDRREGIKTIENMYAYYDSKASLYDCRKYEDEELIDVDD